MGNMFVKEKFVDPYVISVDSILLLKEKVIYGINHQ